jgi:Uri superfamily endonuclease
MINCITIGGDATVYGGVYVLWIHMAAPRTVTFGRFQGGRPIAVPAGDYLYLGSALGRLAARLLRHATRASVRSPALQRAPGWGEERAKALDYEPGHTIRDELAARLAAAGLAARLPVAKRLHWHIDYLLDEPDATLAGVWAWRTAAPLERALAGWLAGQPGVAPLAVGLGASDDRGRTHLLRLAGGGWPEAESASSDAESPSSEAESASSDADGRG